MSKKDLDARKALEILQDAGLDLRAAAERLGATPPAVDEARSLVEEMETAETDAILAMPPVLGRALLWAAAAAGRQDVLHAAVAEGEKEVQREAKRIAHVLKQRGVEIALPQRAPEPLRIAAAPEPEEPPVFLSSLDASGERAVFWTRALPGRGIEMAQLVLSDERGILDLVLGELSRKRFRELVDELPRRGGVTIREISREDARAVIDRARCIARDMGNVPAHFPAWAAQVLGPAPAVAPPPLAPRGDGQPLQEPTILAELVAESPALFDEPEVARWTPSEEAVRQCALAIEEACGADEEERNRAARAAIEKSADAFFDGRRRDLWAARLLDTGRLFEDTERLRAAQIAVAVAQFLAAGVAAAQIPFATELFARACHRGALSHDRMAGA